MWVRKLEVYVTKNVINILNYTEGHSTLKGSYILSVDYKKML